MLDTFLPFRDTMQATVSRLHGMLRLDPMIFVLPAHEEKYRECIRVRHMQIDEFGASFMHLLAPAVRACACILLVRAVFMRAARFIVEHRRRGLWEPKSRHPRYADAEKAIEVAWLSVGSTVFTIWSWKVLATRGSCWLNKPSECLRDWPMRPVPAGVLAYYSWELGWYSHLLLKHRLGLGADDAWGMMMHHAATMTLAVASHCVAAHDMGILMFALFNTSNPLLHLSKLANIAELQWVRTGLFIAFAIVFITTRTIIFPITILYTALLDALEVIPDVLTHFLLPWLLVNTLLWVLYAMQLAWTVKIARVLHTAMLQGGDAAARMSTREDPGTATGGDRIQHNSVHDHDELQAPDPQIGLHATTITGGNMHGAAAPEQQQQQAAPFGTAHGQADLAPSGPVM